MAGLSDKEQTCLLEKKTVHTLQVLPAYYISTYKDREATDFQNEIEAFLNFWEDEINEDEEADRIWLKAVCVKERREHIAQYREALKRSRQAGNEAYIVLCHHEIQNKINRWYLKSGYTNIGRLVIRLEKGSYSRSIGRLSFEDAVVGMITKEDYGVLADRLSSAEKQRDDLASKLKKLEEQFEYQEGKRQERGEEKEQREEYQQHQEKNKHNDRPSAQKASSISSEFHLREDSPLHAGTAHITPCATFSKPRDEAALQKKPLKAEFPTGEAVFFSEEEAAGGGDCGFIVLGASRNQVADCLTPLMDNSAMRERLASEIQQGLETGEFKQDLSKPLFDERTKQIGLYDDLIRQIRASFSEWKSNSKQTQEEQYTSLLAYLKEKDRDLPEIKKMTDQRLACFCAEDAIRLYCNRKEVAENYVKALRHRLWLGYQSALLYAERNNISLYIWEKDPLNYSQLKLIDHHHGNSSKVVYMLHNNRYTHFNLLVECRLDLTIDKSKSITMSQEAVAEKQREVSN